MTITKMQFDDKFRGWSMNEAAFSSFNLLVGMSGVGKTRILNALKAIRNAGIRGSQSVNGCSWQIEFEINSVKYTWSARTSLVARTSVLEFSEEEEDSINSPYFVYESISRNHHDVLVERTPDTFIFNGTQLPKLKNNDSAIALLRDEESIAPLNTALRSILFSEAPNASNSTSSFVHYDEAEYNSVRKRYKTLAALREAPDVPIFVKGFILQKDHPEEFKRIREDYIEIFPSVCDIILGRWTDIDPTVNDESSFYSSLLTVAVKENGVKDWITSQRLSSGMLRTLIHLFELAMAPDGTVIVIDEFENSLGVNCLSPLTDRLLERSRDLQFIITSHHPYIISNIPSRRWRIVTRKGSVITVLNADQVPALRTGSVQDKFIQLINSTEYEEGIK